MQTPREFEAAADRLIQDMNQKYFGGAAFVVGVKLARFDKRTASRVALGLFDSSTNLIYLNYHLRPLLSKRPEFIKAYKSVVWHELCHAMLITAMMPHRLGMYMVEDDHGQEFMELYNRRKFNATQAEMDELFSIVHSRQHLLQDNA